jgi:hypothetical protein
VIGVQEWKDAPVQRVDPDRFRQEIANSQSNQLHEQPEYIVEAKPQVPKPDDWYTNEPSHASNPKKVDYSAYPCERYNNFREPQYIVHIATTGTEEDARMLLVELQQLGVRATLLPWACFDSKRTDFLIFSGLVYSDIAEADSVLHTLKRLPTANEIQLRIITIQPPAL